MVQRANALRLKHVLIVIIATLVLVAISSLFASNAWADPDPVAEKQAEAQAALQSLNTMLNELDEANDSYAAAVGKQEQAKNLMSQTQKRIDAQNERISDLQKQLSSRVRVMYRMGPSTFLDVLFGSTNFISFATNWDLLSNMNSDDALLVQQTKVERSKLSDLQSTYADQKHQADEAAAEAERIRDKANETAKRMQETYDSLSAEAEELLAAQQAALAAAQAAQASQEAQAAQAAQQAQGNVGYYENYENYENAQPVAIADIADFDTATGTATLADGTTATVVGYDIETGNAIVDLAAQFVGGNYGWGAEDPTTSTFDCSGLVQYVYAQNGISVGGHNDRAILNAGTVVDTPETGDILWWDGHVAIYAGDGMMISADNVEMGITYREVSPGATYVRY